MNNTKYEEQKRIFYGETSELENEELWNSFQMDFCRVVRKFSDNKIHAIINIEPESARELIKKFILIVDEHNRGEFESNYHTISILGFNIKKNKKVNIKIQAIPIDENWKKIQESKSREFVFTNEILSLSPIVSFEWPDDNSDVNVVVKWHHVDDQSAQKYVLCLDNKEIDYVNQRSLSSEIETYIYYLKPGDKHTVQIISKLNNGKETHRSDPIHFTVPKSKNKYNTEVLNVCNEPVPSKLRGYIETEKEENSSSRELDPSKDSALERQRVQDRVAELLQKLQNQIDKKKPQIKPP